MELPNDPLDGVWMLHPPPRLAPPRFVRPVPVDPAGLRGPTKGQARGPRWRRTSPNRYVPIDTSFDPTAQRIVEVAESLPAGAAVTAWASLHLAGAKYFDGVTADGRLIPVPVALGPSSHRVTIPGARPRDPTSPQAQGPGARRTRPRRRSLRVTTGDAAQAAVDPRCWAAAPLSNRNVYSLDGTFLARPDLLDPVLGVVGEYDGEHHRETRRRRTDIDREETLLSHGLEFFSVVAGELSQPKVIRRMFSARSRAQASRLPRRWTIERPGHLPPELTLDDLLDLRPPPR